jgi:cytochrome c-type biogenesis protein CcmE
MTKERIPLISRRNDFMRAKYIIGGLLILAAMVFLIVSATQKNSQYFMTVDELLQQSQQMQGRSVRISGAVLGDTIYYDPNTLTLSFTIVAIPGDNDEIESQGGLAAVLHAAVQDPARTRLKIEYSGVRPDQLKNEAQAIVTGTLRADGVFEAEELLLKCPTRYEESIPQQAETTVP